MKYLFLFILSFNAYAANVKDFGALCDNINDDTSEIQEAVNAVQETRGRLDFPAGYCRISGTINISKSIALVGEGRQGSFIIWNNTTMTGFNIVTNEKVNIEKLTFIAPNNATAGSIISLTGGSTTNAFSTIKDSQFVGGYNQFTTQSAYAWILDGNYHYGYVNAGVVVDNNYNSDWGDSTIVNSVMSGGGPNSTSIIQLSSGGLRVNNNKLLGGAYAYRMWLSGNEYTSDLIFIGNSIENQTVSALAFGTSNNGAIFANIVINGNQFMNQPTVINMGNNHRFMSRIVIDGNSMSVVSQYGIVLTNIEDFVITDNQITGISGALNGIAVGVNSQNGKLSGNRTKAFATGVVNNSVSTVVN
jgi:hypothetical protein